MAHFVLSSKMKPNGDQPEAIRRLTARLEQGEKYSTLLGVTGSGKTFTMANVIANVNKPTLVISHNKTLAAQLYAEFKDFFPNNAVHYFVSYYDYYQPEAYIPQRDIYIEKDADINQDIDRLRLASTSALLSRKDVIIVASVSCIYGLGSPEDYKHMVIELQKNGTYERAKLLRKLVDIQYERSHIELTRGKFRVRGDSLDIFPSYLEYGLRIECASDKIQNIYSFNPITGETTGEYNHITLYPAKHFVMPEEKIHRAIEGIRAELEEQLARLRSHNKLLEAQRLEARTRYDLELLQEVGYCKGIENYSRHLSERNPGEPPYTLFDYYPDDFLVIVDESHVTLPQLRGMYHGDRSRKETLVEYGFRLPSTLDNRPLKFEEWDGKVKQVIFASATPSPYEIKTCQGQITEQVIRPTGLVDPLIRVESATHQIQHLLQEIKQRIQHQERVLVTTLTKRLAEDLSHYLQETNIRGKYLHSEIHTIERVQILRDLREGKFDVLVGVNLLREGLDLPEVTLVAILDADKEGFLRSATSIIQTIGRTARNVNGEVILYADKITDSMKQAIAETKRRREIQLKYNREHKIVPETIQKEIHKGIEDVIKAEDIARSAVQLTKDEFDISERMAQLEKEMYKAAEGLDFERAMGLRDLIRTLTRDTRYTSQRRKHPKVRIKI